MDRWIEMPQEAKYGRSVPFRSGGIYYDRDAKEVVKLTNGVCTLAHGDAEAYAAAHTTPGCVYAPSEAVALRVVGVTHNGDPIIAYTHRSVRPEALSEAKDENDPTALMGKVRKSRKIGRV